MADQSESEDILSSEDVETLPADNLEVPTNFNWINSRKGYDYFCQVLERISAPSLISVNVISKSNETESTMAKTLLTSSESSWVSCMNYPVVFPIAMSRSSA